MLDAKTKQKNLGSFQQRQSGSKSIIIISGKGKVCMTNPLFPLIIKNIWLDNEYIHPLSSYHIVRRYPGLSCARKPASNYKSNECYPSGWPLQLPRRQQVGFGLQTASWIARSYSNHNILVSHIFYEEHLATILLVLLWQTAMLNNCDHIYNIICTLQYHSRGLCSTGLNRQSKSYNLNLPISHPQKD